MSVRDLLRREPLGHIGRYAILGRIATGGMAEILLGRDDAMGGVSRLVVVKRLLTHIAKDARRADMFVTEASLAMRLKHPAICSLYEVGTQGGEKYIAMEYVQGASMFEVIRRARRKKTTVPVPIALRMIAVVAEALHYAHTLHDENRQALGIVHRDVTPENIMVSFDGSVKLLDFGVAKAKSQTHATQTGEVKGKFGYMSPEQYLGQTLDARSDVFALGACLYEVLVGDALYSRATEMETIAAVLLSQGTPSVRDALPDIPASIDDIVRQALARTPENRFPDARTMQQAIERVLLDERMTASSAEIAAYMHSLFGADADAPPKVHHDLLAPLSLASDAPPRSPSLDAMKRIDLAVAADEEMEEIANAQKRRRYVIAAVITLIILGGIGLLGYAIRAPL